MSTFTEIVRQHEAEGGPRRIAQAIWDEHGAAIFALLPADYVVSMLAERVRTIIHSRGAGQRPSGLKVVPASLGTCRMALGRNYWAKKWLVAGTYRETRELTIADLRWLMDDRTRASEILRAQVLFFETNMALAKKHGVKILGDLEKMGIELLEAAAIEEEAAA